jgi:hypothetical protein
MADAGFFYTQSGDRAVTHCCNISVSNWRETDNPYQKHAQLTPDKCPFLNYKIGFDHVDAYKASDYKPAIGIPTSVDGECAVCHEPNIKTVVSPCGHAMCNDCAYEDMFNCCVCRMPIREIMEIFK